jgi:hypothetical protein
VPQSPTTLVQVLPDILVDRLRTEPKYTSSGSDQLPDWNPVPAECHGNADRWAVAHPSDIACVAGCASRSTRLHRFVAHSMVRTGAGTLIDACLDGRAGDGFTTGSATGDFEKEDT